MTRVAFYRSRDFYLYSIVLWLISLLVLGTRGALVVPGMLLFFLPGLLVGEKLTGQLRKSSPAPLICAILIGFTLSGATLLFSGSLFGFNPLINVFSLITLTVLATLFSLRYQSDECACPQYAQLFRNDYYALLAAGAFLMLFILPAYLKVGQFIGGSHGYTQWFSLDFLLSKTFTAALSRTDILPPRYPFFPKFTLRYHYWFHILPAYLYQLTAAGINLERLLLFLYFLADAVFLVSVYLLFCERIKQFQARVAAFLLLLVANSLEGLFFIYLQLGKGPLANVFLRNLEMRFIPSLLTPYLHLLYIVPHLFTAAYFYLLYVLLIKRGDRVAYLIAGLSLGAASGMSVFMALQLAFFCLLIFFYERVWQQDKGWYRVTIFICAALAVSLWLSFALRMFAKPDISAYLAKMPAEQLAQAKKVTLTPGIYGLGRFNLASDFGVIGPYIQIAAECLPALLFLFWALYLTWRNRDFSKNALELTMALSLLFAYLFIAIGPANRLISHKVSLTLYLFCAVSAARVFEMSPRSKKTAWSILLVFTLLSLPTLILNFGYIINLDNPKEVTRVTSSDYQAAQWIKNNLPSDAVIQSFPNYPAWPHQYSLIPMFAERDTAVGSFKRVRDVLSYNELVVRELKKVSALYSPKLPQAQARMLLDEYRIGYLYYGPVENRVFGQGSLDYLTRQNRLYRVIYQKQGVVIFQVIRT